MLLSHCCRLPWCVGRALCPARRARVGLCRIRSRKPVGYLFFVMLCVCVCGTSEKVMLETPSRSMYLYWARAAFVRARELNDFQIKMIMLSTY